jgi:hypothetical protein
MQLYAACCYLKQEGKAAIITKAMRKRTNISKQKRKKHEYAEKEQETKKKKEKQHRKRNEGKKISIPDPRDLVMRYFS